MGQQDPRLRSLPGAPNAASINKKRKLDLPIDRQARAQKVSKIQKRIWAKRKDWHRRNEQRA